MLRYKLTTTINKLLSKIQEMVVLKLVIPLKELNKKPEYEKRW